MLSSEDREQLPPGGKVVLVGDAGCGKTSLVRRLCSELFVHGNRSTTIGFDFQCRSFHVDGQLYAMDLWDTAGCERHRSLLPSLLRHAEVALVCFDVGSLRSLAAAPEWASCVRGVSPTVALVLVACKLDSERTVDQQAGQRAASELGAAYAETSSATGDGCDALRITLEAMLGAQVRRRLRMVALDLVGDGMQGGGPMIRTSGPRRTPRPPKTWAGCC